MASQKNLASQIAFDENILFFHTVNLRTVAVYESLRQGLKSEQEYTLICHELDFLVTLFFTADFNDKDKKELIGVIHHEYFTYQHIIKITSVEKTLEEIGYTFASIIGAPNDPSISICATGMFFGVYKGTKSLFKDLKIVKG